MSSFLITFKPSTENKKRGWPLVELQRLVKRLQKGEPAQEWWRFRNIKDVQRGDRAFLLLQGKGGPAIIGYGHVTGRPEKRGGHWQAPIMFERLTDPTISVLAGKQEITAISGAERYWRTMASGILLPADLANTIADLAVGRSPTLIGDGTANPDWTRDELIVALNVYLQHRPNPPGKDSEVIVELSRILNRLGAKLFPPAQRGATFRNANGVYMKLMNFRRLDPEYTAKGKTGLVRGAKAEEDIWAEFAHDPERCKRVAEAILAALDDPDNQATWIEPDADGLEEAEEGRLLTRQHTVRERNRKLIATKIKQVLKRTGKLVCEVCEFDFARAYGERGKGFVECHHTKPVTTLRPGQKTHINDLAVVCANCHRMIHRRKPWLSVAELSLLLPQSAMPPKSSPPPKTVVSEIEVPVGTPATGTLPSLPT